MSEKKDKHFIKKPIYEGGNKAMSAFIKKHLKYPKEALEKKIEGTVQVHYEINWKGKVTKARVVNKLGHGCDEEAIRLIKLLEFKVPKEPYKARVKFGKKTNINFRLPKMKKQSQQVRLNYSLKTAENKPQDDLNSNSGYSYTIRIN